MSAETLRIPLIFGLASLSLVACRSDPWPEPPPISSEALMEGHEEWREGRREYLAGDGAAVVLWIGLWELKQGATELGSDASLPVVLPAEDAPPLAGVIHRSGRQVRLEPSPGVGWGLGEGASVKEALVLESDRADSTTTLTLGSLALQLHEEQGSERRWLRAWDTDSPAKETFVLPEVFPIDADWRITARFDPYPEPRVVTLADVTDGTVEDETPGELVFRVEGEEHRLIAFASENSRDFFVMIWDSTAVEDTYEAGRYVHVPFPDEEGWTHRKAGWTTIDFNRAYNPPCVFSPYSVCGFPPRENRLPIFVPAGERRPGKPAL